MKRTLLLLIIMGMSATLQSQTWTSAADIPEPIRAGNTASYAKNGDGFLFVVSGRNQDGIITPKHQRYQLSTNSWTDMPDYPTGILGATAAVVKDSLYVIGGLVTTPGVPSNKVYKYSIDQNTWTQVANYPTQIVDAKAVAYQDSLIYVVGGYTRFTRIYNTHTNQWRTATPILPPGQKISWGGFSVKGDTLVYVCGTDNFLSTNYFNTVRIGIIDQTNRANITWSTATAFPGQTRTFFDAQPWKDGIIMTGGSTDNTFETSSDECYHYNVGTDTWTQLPSKPTPWLTGNSGSVFIDGEWKLICSSGFGTGYLSETEIFTDSNLSVNAMEKDCSFTDFRIANDSVTTIQFCLENNGNVDLELHDASGKSVKKLSNIASSAGFHTFNIDMGELPKGVYICTLKQGKATATKKMLLK